MAAPSAPARFAAIALLASLAGCGFEPPPLPVRYALAPATVAAFGDDAAARERFQAELDAVFGTPAQPRFLERTDFRPPDLAPGARYPTLAESARLYRAECLACHGPEGGGDGPSSFDLQPRPRDLRLGIVKYTALETPLHARHADLVHTLTEGVFGTSMPPFERLALADRQGLADLARLLAVRGEVERRLAAAYADEGDLVPDAVARETEDVWGAWQEAERRPVLDDAPPPQTPELLARGAKLFADPLKGNCASCHGPGGHGDGAAAWKVTLNGREPAYLDAWGDPILPRDLTRGVFHGGARPIDLFRRVWAGIPGTPMPALGHSKGPDGAPLVSREDVWALVFHVRRLAGLAPSG